MRKLIICFILMIFAAAHGSPAYAAVKLKIICSTFPQYDWVRQILGKRAESMNLTLLLDNGADLHNYQPSIEEMIMIYNCDLFIHIGGESDSWVDDVLNDVANDNITVVNLAAALGDAVVDEHVWLSFRHAKTLCKYIADKLGELDPENTSEYAANAAEYAEKLEQLDERYRSTVAAAKQKTILFGDRFPFRYLADDYGLSYFAAFAEASLETVAFLANKADELGLSSISYIEGTPPNLARTISENTKSKDQKLVAFNSMQSITLYDVKGGVSYISIMERNLEALRDALN